MTYTLLSFEMLVKSQYFYDNLKDILSKVFDNDSDITSLSPLSEESLSLSTESFKEWDVTY